MTKYRTHAFNIDPTARKRAAADLAAIRARYHGMRNWVLEREGEQAQDLLDALTQVGIALRRAELIAAATPQQRVVDRICQAAHSGDTPWPWPKEVYEIAAAIAKMWPWNTTEFDWWAHRRNQ